MIRINITRKCGHVEIIAMPNVSDGVVKEIWDKNITWQKDKFCLPCFEKLPTEEKRRLLKEAILSGQDIDYIVTREEV